MKGLLDLPAADLRQSLNQASELLCSALDADKIDVFLFEPSRKTLRALGTGNTPLGRLQQAPGLDVQAVANGGSIAGVFTTGEPYLAGHADREPGEVPGVIHELGVRSHIAVPLVVEGERRGVVSAQSPRPEFFTEGDLRFLSTVSRWIGALTHRAELVEQVTTAAVAQGRRQAAEELITVLAHDLRNYLGPLIGLGLYLASRIAAAHGATLTVNSPPGDGATFRLSLPVSGPPDHARGA